MLNKNFFVFFMLLSIFSTAVIKEDDQQSKETFDDIVKKVYDRINSSQNKDRKLQYESIVPYYMPFGENQRYYIPFGDKNIPGGEKMDKFSYDPNQSRFDVIYHNYYRMLNKNLQFLSNIQKYQYDSDDNRFRQLDNPESFEYDHYFDGFSDHETMNQKLPTLYHKKNLQQQEENQQDHEEDLEESEEKEDIQEQKQERKLQEVVTKDTLKQLQRRLRQVNKHEKKLQRKQQYLQQMKNFYEKNYPEIINKIGLIKS